MTIPTAWPEHLPVSMGLHLLRRAGKVQNYIAGKLVEWYHINLAEDFVLGEEAVRFEDIVIPAGTYAIFETERCQYPTQKHVELRKRIASEWLPSSDYILTDLKLW